MTQVLEQPAAPAGGYDVIAKRAAAIQTLVDFALQYQNAVGYRTAVAGKLDGVTLEVPGAQRRIYVQLGAVGGEESEAQFDMYRPALGDTILLTRPRLMGLGGWLVLGWVKGTELPCYSAVEN